MAEVDKKVNVQIGVSTADAPGAVSLAPVSGLAVQVGAEKHLLDPFSWILIGGGALAVAHFIVETIDKSKGGVVIDLSGGDRKPHRDKDVPYGWALIISADGKEVRIETHDAPRDATERLISEIISGGYKTAAEIKNAAAKVLPGSKVE